MVANYVASIGVDTVIDALAEFLQVFLPPNGEVIRAQVNRVSPPPSPYIELTEILQVDLNIPFEDFLETTQFTNINASKKIDIQVDIYGSDSGDYCAAIKSALRTGWGYAQFPVNVKPLFCDDGRQHPLITGEEQYERRWTLTASLQYNPIVTVPQQSATVLDATIEVPTDFPIP